MIPILFFLILFSQPMYLDVEGQQEITLNIIDRLMVSDDGETLASGLFTRNNIYITDGYFNNPSTQGCNTFLHERYHAINGDWYHETMPNNCQDVWKGLK